MSCNIEKHDFTVSYISEEVVKNKVPISKVVCTKKHSASYLGTV